jgi:hypothetical protein
VGARVRGVTWDAADTTSAGRRRHRRIVSRCRRTGRAH